jgi:hypothetical protein
MKNEMVILYLISMKVVKFGCVIRNKINGRFWVSSHFINYLNHIGTIENIEIHIVEIYVLPIVLGEAKDRDYVSYDPMW